MNTIYNEKVTLNMFVIDNGKDKYYITPNQFDELKGRMLDLREHLQIPRNGSLTVTVDGEQIVFNEKRGNEFIRDINRFICWDLPNYDKLPKWFKK